MNKTNLKGGGPMKNNRGFSLVELVVAMAILAIIGLAVVGFMGTGTNLFGSVSNETDVQEEAQITLNQISDLVTSSTRGVSYYYGDSESNLVLSDEGVPSDVSKKTLVIYNSDCIYNVIWKSQEKKIYLRKDTIDASGTITKGKESLMAEYVTAFSPSLKEAETKSSISIKVSFKANKKVYSTSQNFTMRNKPKVNESTDKIYEDKLTTPVTVTGIKIFNNGEECSGKSIIFMTQYTSENKGVISFSSSVQGTGFPSQEVNWSVEGANDADTKIQAGKLVIGLKETASSITVSVTSKINQAFSTNATVSLKDITGITLSGPDVNKKYSKGEVFRVDATVIGTNLDNNDKGIKWSCSGASCISYTNTFAEFKITAMAGETVSVTATSNKNSSISNSITGITVSDSNYQIKLNAESSQIYNGGQVVFTPTVTPNDGAYGEIEWTVTVRQVYDDNTESDPIDRILLSDSWNYDNSWQFSYKINDGKCYVRCGPNVNTGARYKVYVIARLKNDNSIYDQTSIERRKY